MKTTLDLERCRSGMRELQVEGRARPELIEEAIAAIQSHRVNALRDEYFGIKHYANFGDQRADCRYGTVPAHGGIVFRIGRTDDARRPGYALSDDAIYLLEAYRDFEPVRVDDEHGRTVVLYLTDAILAFDRLSRARNLLADAFAAVAIEPHIDGAGGRS